MSSGILKGSPSLRRSCAAGHDLLRPDCKGGKEPCKASITLPWPARLQPGEVMHLATLRFGSRR